MLDWRDERDESGACSRAAAGHLRGGRGPTVVCRLAALREYLPRAHRLSRRRARHLAKGRLRAAGPLDRPASQLCARLPCPPTSAVPARLPLAADAAARAAGAGEPSQRRDVLGRADWLCL